MSAHALYAGKGWWPWSRSVEIPEEPNATSDEGEVSEIQRELIAARVELQARIAEARQAGGQSISGLIQLRKEREDTSAEIVDAQKRLAQIEAEIAALPDAREIDETLMRLEDELRTVNGRLHSLETFDARSRSRNGRSAA